MHRSCCPRAQASNCTKLFRGLRMRVLSVKPYGTERHRSSIDRTSMYFYMLVRSISRVRTLVCSLHPLWWCPRAAGSALDVCSFVGAASRGICCLCPLLHIHTASTLVKCCRCSGRSVADGGAGGVQACGALRRSRWYSILDVPHRSSLLQHPFLCTHHLRGHGCAMVGARFLQQHGPR